MIDPFSSHLPRYHPKRVFFKLYVTALERRARQKYDAFALPLKQVEGLPEICCREEICFADTAVTARQMRLLLKCLQVTERLRDTVVVEVGAYKGVTTRCLASATSRKVVAVDLFHPVWHESEVALAAFLGNTSHMPNVVLERKSSGAACRRWSHGKVSLLFIDAQHNYVNTKYDVSAWLPKLVEEGFLALHDTDRLEFAGTRRAAFESARKLSLYAHIDNLVIFQK
jgi:predicted O-methyltransferase YrrM